MTLLAFLGLAAGQEIIIDNRSGEPEFVLTGDDWTTWETLGHGYDSSDVDYHYLSHTVGGSDRKGKAKWIPTIQTAGTYEIATWFRKTENRSSDADFVVTDGKGQETTKVLDQRGEGASGWVKLATVWCAAGSGGCKVVLDGTDDDQSDEANAVRFKLVQADEGGGGDPDPDPETKDCQEFPGLGQHSMILYPNDLGANGWSSATAAAGQKDGSEAHSENVDAGEYLRAGGWGACDPVGEERIDSVTLAVYGRTQYDSGDYNVRLRLDGGGSASKRWNGVSAAWHEVDLSGDRSWTWGAVDQVQAQVSLHDHPQGKRDSDAWVDAFRLTVVYTTTAAPDGGGEPDPNPEDSEQPFVEDSWSDWDSEVDGDTGGPVWPPGPRAQMTGCSATAGGAWMAGLLLLLLRRR